GGERGLAGGGGGALGGVVGARAPCVARPTPAGVAPTVADGGNGPTGCARRGVATVSPVALAPPAGGTRFAGSRRTWAAGDGGVRPVESGRLRMVQANAPSPASSLP